jgi:hypothetical protein
LPHSDTSGSKFIKQLPEAYRSLSRPSSPLGAKASTVCPYYAFYLALFFTWQSQILREFYGFNNFYQLVSIYIYAIVKERKFLKKNSLKAK